MANITILQQPDAITPAYNDNVWVVSGTNTAQANFKFICDVIVNGQSFRQAVFPDPTHSRGIFNVGRVVENYISDTLNTNVGFQENVGSIIQYSVQFGEEYGLASSGTTIYPNQVSSSKYVWNGIIDFLPYQSYDYTDYVMNTTDVVNFLTNAPSSGVISTDENAWLYGMVESSGVVYHARINTYDSSDNLLQTVKVNNPYQSIGSDNSQFVRFGSGTRNLNLIESSGITDGGSQPIITNSVTKYYVVFQTYAGVEVSNRFYYKVEDPCTKNNTYRLHFLNKLGGFDSFTFIRADRKTATIDRKEYKKRVTGMTSDSTWGYSTSAHNRVNFDTTLDEVIAAQSDWISEATNDWLYELVTSPVVYLDDPTYGLVGVNIVNTAYDFKTEAVDKLFNLTIQFKYSFQTYRQRR